MHNTAIIIGALLLALLAAGTWQAIQGESTLLVAEGATGLTITDTRPGERRISYMMLRPEDGWVSNIGRRLKLDGWMLDVDSYAWGNTEQYLPVYTRNETLFGLRIIDRVELRGDRSHALIIATRRLSWHWPALLTFIR